VKYVVPVSTLIVGVLLVLVVLGISLFAFGAFASHLRRSESALVAGATAAASQHPQSDAVTLARALAPNAIDPALLLVIVDANSRATIRWDPALDRSTPHVFVRPRADRSAEPLASDLFARSALGLATAFGLQTLRANAGEFEIYATPNQQAFAEDVRAYVPAFAIAVAVALLCGVVVGRVLTRAALDPLDRVTAALQRFAHGDFTAEPIAGSQDGRLGALAAAYDGAVAQVERSFAERARAHAAMRQFIADAGHQFKTPLTVVRGLVTILSRSGFGPDSEETAILHTIARQTSLMSALVEKLLLLEAWEGRDALPNAIDAGALVSEAVRPLALANPQREIAVDAAHGLVVCADPLELEYAIVNVVDNALKYTAARVRVTVDGDAERVRITVADDGPGMDREEAARAVDRFYRGARRDVEGSGLGLAIAQRAVERAGGRLELHSDRTRGTIVTLVLPRDGPLSC
jgi:two-component system OmpR family sensor kinase